MRKREDILGKKFGKLTVIEFVGIKKHHAQWLCACDCGLTTLAYTYALNSGEKVSCGCIKGEASAKHLPHKSGAENHSYKHGGTTNGKRERLWMTWWNMLKRCETPSANRYEFYGGRGISVCPEWHDYTKFREWAYSNGYYDEDPSLPRRQKLSIDRIDNNGDYEPDNCRWVKLSENVANRNRLHANQR